MKHSPSFHGLLQQRLQNRERISALVTIQEIITASAQQLIGRSTTPRLDVEVLLMFVLGCSRMELIRDGDRAIQDESIEMFRHALERRVRGEPVAYITGQREFFGRPFTVTPSVLIPRPDTEILVEEALQRADNIAGEIKILDCGTGSGCIAVTLAAELVSRGRDVSVLAVDKSKDALAIAERNVNKLGVSRHLELRESDWFSAVRPDEHFHLIVANPPYIAENETNLSPELAFEPSQALFSQDHGYRDLRAIITGSLLREHPPEALLLECGSTQARALADWISECTALHTQRLWQTEVRCDLAGFERLVVVC